MKVGDLAFSKPPTNLYRAASNSEEDLVRNRINRAVKAIDNAIGPKAMGHFLAMPTVLNQ